MRHYYIIILAIMSMLTLFSCKSNQPLQTVPALDIHRYSGVWFEIARLPNSFEKGLDCVTAEYSLLPDQKIKVVNKGRKFTKDLTFDQVTGKAWIPDQNFPGRLKVSFFWPFAGDYWVFSLSEDYRFALVGTESRKYFWLLARDSQIDPVVFDSLLSIAAQNGFNVKAVEKINQDCYSGGDFQK